MTETQVVTLDGVAIPLVDPQNFQEFWNEREELRQREQERELRYATKVSQNESSNIPGNSRRGKSDSQQTAFYNTGRQQGALALYGQGPSDNVNGTHPHPQQQRRSGQQKARTRPQSASTQSRRRQQGRPSSSMSRTAPAVGSRRVHAGRPQSAQPSRRRRRRPKSARLSGTTGQGARRVGDRIIPSGSEEDRRRVMEDYANSIKAQRRVRPTSSAEYIKLRAARRRQQAKEFADSLKSEEKRKKIEIRSKVQEMNKWVLSNGQDLNFTVLEDANAGAHGIAVHVLARGKLLRRLGIGSFEREHDKMKIEMDRKKALRALSSDNNMYSGGADNNQAEHHGNGHEMSSSPHRVSSRGRSRRVVQNELKSILSDTEQLTVTLVSQLKELRSCGWNVGFF